jgi:DNA polymerase-3 subunit epsilon
MHDAQETAAVLAAQLFRYSDLGAMDRQALAEFSRLDARRIDLAGKFLRDDDGDAVYNFGKNKGQKVKDDMGLIFWMLNTDFSANTLFHARKIIDAIQNPPEPTMDDDPFVPQSNDIPF